MPTRTIFTDGSNTPITLTVNDVHGHRIATIIDINGTELPPIQGDFNDRQLGTNSSLAGATVNVTTTSLKVTPAVNSQLNYALKGTGQDIPDSDSQSFGAGNPVVTHLMTYIIL